ncbi:MAG: hypothetical protein AAB343_00930 [Patescibacteria group bacterium]
MQTEWHLVGLAEVVDRRAYRRVGYFLAFLNGRKVRVPIDAGRACNTKDGCLVFHSAKERRVPRVGESIVLQVRQNGRFYEAVRWGFFPD